MSSASSVPHTLVRLLQPSFFSLVATFVISISAVLVLLAPQLYRGSDFALYFNSLNIEQTTGYGQYRAVSNAVNTSNLAADISVFVVWMMIGFVAYSIVMSLAKLLGGLVHFVRDIEYFRENRRRIVIEAFLHLVVRIGAALTIYGLYLLFMKFGLTYIFIFAYEALAGSWLMGVWYVFLMGIILAFCVHIFVVLARVAALRIRVFYDRYFVADA